MGGWRSVFVVAFLLDMVGNGGYCDASHQMTGDSYLPDGIVAARVAVLFKNLCYNASALQTP